MDTPWIVLRERFLDLATLPPVDQAMRLDAIRAAEPALHAQLVPLLASDRKVENTELLDSFHARVVARPWSGRLPSTIGPYEIVGVLGEGAMGRVYLAHDPELDRDVALKVIRSGELADPAECERFVAEARAMAQLQHPGIVPVYDFGMHEGMPYFTMAVIAGKSLADSVAECPIPPRECAELMHQVAEAMEFAHQKGVMHRDLKPGNILLDQQRTRITDFGLSKRVRTDGAAEAEGSVTVVGTVPYMAPEQTYGWTHPGVDVYAIGATLYHLLTGHAPFHAATVWETMDQVRALDPVPPRKSNPRIPVDLQTICLACLEKRPEKRYPSAAALAADLQRFLDHQPIVRRPVGPLGRLARWAARNRRSVAILGVAAIAAGVALGVAIRSDRARRAAEREQALADDQRRAAEKDQRLAGFLRDVGTRAKTIDRQVRDVEHLVEILAISARDALFHAPVGTGPVFLDHLSARPPDLAFAPRYGRPIGLAGASTFVAREGRGSNASSDEAEIERARRLEWIVPEMRRLVWSNPVSTTTRRSQEPEPTACADLPSFAENPVIWCYLGLPPCGRGAGPGGTMFTYPGYFDNYPPEFDPTHRDWYRGAVAALGKTYWTPLYGDVGEQGLVLTCSRAFKDRSGVYSSVAAIDVSPLLFTQHLTLAGWRVRETSLVDRRGCVRIQSGQTGGAGIDWKAFLEPPLLAYPTVVSAITVPVPTSDLIEVELDGRPCLVSYTYLDAKDWYYVVVIERAHLYGE